MKKADIAKAVLNGDLIAVVEYRGSTAVTYRADAAKNRAAAVAIRHRVELKNEALEITEYVPDEQVAKFDVEKFNAAPPPFRKGEHVLWHIKSFSWSERGRRASGTLERIDD